MSNLRSDAAAAGNPTPYPTPASGIPPNTAAPRSGNSEKQDGSSDNLYRILPIDDKKPGYPHGGHDLHSDFHVGPAMMPGPFVSSMGTSATAFERDLQNKDATKAKKE
ncbi:hypothetical protein BGW41_005227 [Actinomortierella wolfii]|nr:hypothetical protein BGW41_005227 [Actinomortierella wolfii]